MYINNELRMTLTYFTARSTLVANAFEWGKTFKMSFKVKVLQEMGSRAKYL